MNARHIALGFASMVISALAALPARADHYFAVEQLAAQLQSQTGQLSAEIRGNFRQAPNFGPLVGDSQQLYSLSARMRALSQANVNPAALISSVRQMERLVADLENRVQDANFGRGRVVYRGFGPSVAPCDTRLAMRMLADIDRTLANLDDAADDLDRAPCRVQPPHYGNFDDDYGVRGPGPGYAPTFRGRGF